MTRPKVPIAQLVICIVGIIAIILLILARGNETPRTDYSKEGGAFRHPNETSRARPSTP